MRNTDHPFPSWMLFYIQVVVNKQVYFAILKLFRLSNHCSMSALRNICLMGVSRVGLLKLDCKIGYIAFRFCVGIYLSF